MQPANANGSAMDASAYSGQVRLGGINQVLPTSKMLLQSLHHCQIS